MARKPSDCLGHRLVREAASRLCRFALRLRYRPLDGPFLGCPLALDWHQHFLLAGGCLARPLGWFRRCRRRLANTLAQWVHQVDDVLAAWPSLGRDRLPGSFAIDEFDERSFILILELCRLESPCLLVDDVFGQIEHVLRHFDVLDVVEILRL